MKTNLKETKGMNWLRPALSWLADACVLSGAAQGGVLPPEPVLREVAARMTARVTPTRLTEVGAAPTEAPVWLFGCCGCCVS